MTPIRGPLARLDRSREELAKAWLVRLIERASLDEIRDLPTDRIAGELPDLITDVLRRRPATARPVTSSAEEQRARGAPGRAARRPRRRRGRPGARRGRHPGRDPRARCARSWRRSTPSSSPTPWSAWSDAIGAIQAAAAEELVRRRSRELESLANSDPLTGLSNLRHLQRSSRTCSPSPSATSTLRAAGAGRRRAQAHQRLPRPPGRRPRAGAGGAGRAPLDPHGGHRRPDRRRRVLRARPRAGRRRTPGLGERLRRGGRGGGHADERRSASRSAWCPAPSTARGRGAPRVGRPGDVRAKAGGDGVALGEPGRRRDHGRGDAT